MSLDGWFGLLEADLKTSRWDRGHFVTGCTACGREMIELPGLEWKLRENAG